MTIMGDLTNTYPVNPNVAMVLSAEPDSGVVRVESEYPLMFVEPEKASRWQTTYAAGKHAVEAAVVFTAWNPFTSGPLRYGAFAATEAATDRNVLASAAVLAGSTLLLEGAGALATANLLATETANKTIQSVNKWVSKVIRPEARITPVSEVVIANYLGTPALLVVKQREDPTRSREQNQRHGMLSASLLSGAIAVQGALIAEGVANYEDFTVLGAAATGLVGIGYVLNKLKGKFMKSKKELKAEEDEHDVIELTTTESREETLEEAEESTVKRKGLRRLWKK